jgi:enamine deaminase RidA (YjgF/YER057c/UK114 family)
MKKSIITSSTISNPYGLYPLGTRAGDLAFLSLQVPTNTETKRLVRGYKDLRADDLKRAEALATGLATSDSREGPAIAQVWQCYSQTADLLKEIGSSINNTLFTMLYLTDMSDYPEFTRSRRAFFAPDVPPASTSAMIGALPHPDAVFGFDAYAFIPDPNRPSHRMVALNESRHVKHLQLSDYGLASKVGALLFLAGVVASRPERGLFVHGLDDLGIAGERLSTGSALSDDLEGPMLAQTQFIYDVLKGILEEQGSSLDHVLRTVIWLTDMRSLPSVERISRAVFRDNLPATTICGTYQQAREDFLLEIEAIALLPAVPGAPVKESFEHKDVFPRTGYNTGMTVAGDLIFTSAILPLDNAGRLIGGPADVAMHSDAPRSVSMIMDALDGRVAAQAWAVHRTLKQLLAEHGSSIEDVLKLNLYLKDMNDFPLVARIGQEFFRNSPPAITPIQAAHLPVKGARLQIDAIALKSR